MLSPTFAAFSQIHSNGYYSLQYASTNTDTNACVQHDVAEAFVAWYFRNKRGFQGREYL